MRNLNISITNEQYNLVQNLIQELGFANRSEFFRTMIRVIAHSPKNQFQTPPTKDAKKVIGAFRKTEKYNDKFLASIETGLLESSYFNS